MIRIAVVEDDPVTRIGLVNVVRGQDDLVLTAESRSVEEFESSGASEDTDLVVLDLNLRGGGLDGADAIKKLVASGHVVLVVSVEDQEFPVRTAMAAGAHGYLTKEAEPEELLRAIRDVALGRSHISASVAGYLLRTTATLSDREVEVLRLIASGETAAQTAEQLVISVKTVNRHLERIRAKIGEGNKAALTRFAVDRGIIPRFLRRK